MKSANAPAVTQPSFWKSAGSLAKPTQKKLGKMKSTSETQRMTGEILFVVVTFEGSIGARVFVDRENLGALYSQGGDILEEAIRSSTR
jgi:hypothetical protein